MSEENMSDVGTENSNDSTATDESQGGQQSAPVENVPKKRKVKVDGTEIEVTDEDLVRDYQLKEASYKRMTEASQLAKSVKPFIPIIEALKKGDLNVLRELGLPKKVLREFSERELLEYLEEQEMSPAEREAKDAKRERDELKAAMEKEKSTRAELERERYAVQAAQEIETEIIEALKEIDVPMKGNYRMVQRMAEEMFAALEAGEPRMTAKEARDKFLGSIKLDAQEYIGREFKKNPEGFIDSLPAELLDGIRKRDLNRVANQMPLKRGDSIQSKKPRETDAFRDYMREELAKRG